MQVDGPRARRYDGAVQRKGILMARMTASILLALLVLGPVAQATETPAPAAPAAKAPTIETPLPTFRDLVPQLAYDGKPDTFYQSARPPQADETFTMTFAQPVRLKRVEVLTGSPDGKGTLEAGVLETSADGKAFSKVAKFVSGAAKADLTGAEVKAVRLRVTAEASASLAIREITLDAQPAVPVFAYPVEIRLDYTEVPEMKEWCEKAARTADEWYPKIAEILKSDGYTPTRRISLIFKKGQKGIAGTSGSKIVCYDGWFKAHPDDVGAIIHEVIHVVQAYPKYDPPWLVEGLADYVRFWMYEAKPPSRRLDPNRIKYTDSYQVTGAFLAWAVKNGNPDLVTKLNVILRKGEYKESTFKDITGKDLDTLWEEFKKSLSQ